MRSSARCSRLASSSPPPLRCIVRWRWPSGCLRWRQCWRRWRHD